MHFTGKADVGEFRGHTANRKCVHFWIVQFTMAVTLLFFGMRKRDVAVVFFDLAH